MFTSGPGQQTPEFSTTRSIQSGGSSHLNFVDSLGPLLGRTLVLIAHPDDEAVGCGGLLPRIPDPIVVFATDGAPRSDYFWKHYGSREAYARLRAQEAESALAAVGVTHVHRLSDELPIVDQELYLNLSDAHNALSELIETELPQAILSHAYEGGHPDHDACAFLAFRLAEQFRLPVWEMPLYHAAGGEAQRQSFIDPAGQIVTELTRDELARKHDMYLAYHSQAVVLADFHSGVERFRPMRKYDFSLPPHRGVLNYESWQWPITGSDLCRQFQSFLQHKPDPPRERQWRTVA